MRQLLMGVLLLALVALLAGCPPEAETGGGVDTAGPAPTPAPAPTPDDEVVDEDTTEDVAGGPQVLAVTVGDEADEEGTAIVNETDVFTPETPAVYCRADLTGVTVGSTVKGTLIAVSVVDAAGTEGADIEVASKEVEAPVEEFPVTFNFTVAGQPWPVGDYVVLIAVDDDVLEEVEMTCVGDEEPTE